MKILYTLLKAEIFILFLMFFMISSTLSLADERLDIFLEKSAKFLESYKPLDHVDSPFRPYLQRPFEEGLEEKARARYRRARDKGDCIPVHMMMMQGFLGLYPFLKSAFDDTERGRKLYAQSSVNAQPGTRLCYVNLQLIGLFSRKPKKEFQPIDLGLQMAVGPFVRPPGDESNPLANMISLQLQSGNLAFCDDYLPAIEAVLNDANRAGGMVLAQEEELYLIERALQKKGSTAELLKRLARLKIALPPARYQSARSAARKRRLDALKIVSGFWWKACRTLQDSRQREAQR